MRDLDEKMKKRDEGRSRSNRDEKLSYFGGVKV